MQTPRGKSMWRISVGAPRCSTSTHLNPTLLSSLFTCLRMKHTALAGGSEVVVSRASFRRIRRNGKVFLLQAGDADQGQINNLKVPWKKRSKTQGFLCHLALYLCGVLEVFQMDWTDVCGFVQPPKSDSEAWCIRDNSARCKSLTRPRQHAVG